EASNALGGHFVQEFEFNAHSGDFRGRVDEVEMLMVNHDDSLELMVEVDRKAKGLGGFFASMIGRDETKLWVEIHDYDLDAVTDVLHGAIDEHC
ncbi:MAG: sporulation protein, partial [Psychrobium sp.]